MDQPKILVGTPIFDFNDYCIDEYYKTISSFTYPNYDIFLTDNSKDTTFFNKLQKMGIPAMHMQWLEKSRERICKGHNILREKTLNEGYDYLFLVDADVIPPKDVIEKLLAHNKKIITGIYFNPMTCPDGIVREFPVVRLPNPKDKTKWIMTTLHGMADLIKIAGAGTGCVLIHRSILEKYKFWFDATTKGADDIFFFKQMYDDDIDMFADTTIICKHLVKEKPFSWQKKDYKENTY
jgi:GT2 family glycosyltransferase